MLAEWSVECSSDDPVLVVPWTADSEAPSGSRPDPDALLPRFIDLRENPYDLEHIPEAEQFPPLMHALRALNAARSPVFTAKCDAWTLASDELDDLHQNLDLDFTYAAKDTPGTALAGFASYIDILLRERSLFASFHQNEQLLHRLSRRATPLDHPHAMLDCIIRPALLDLTTPQEGFSITLYVKALGSDPQTASEHWAAALQAVVALLRGKDLL